MKKTKRGFTPLEIKEKRGGLSLTGFTLLELLVAVTIFAVTALAIYSSFYAGIRIFKKAQDVMRLHQELRLAAEEISLDLRNCLPFPVTEEAPAIAGAEEAEEPVYFFLGEKKRFTFVTLRDYFSEEKAKRQICNVTYYFDAADGKGLMRIAKYQGRGFISRAEEEEELLSGIDDIEVQYSYEADDEDSPPVWLDWWEEEEKIPLGVKIIFRLKGLGSLKEITKTVFIPIGVLGVREEGGRL